MLTVVISRDVVSTPMGEQLLPVLRVSTSLVGLLMCPSWTNGEAILAAWFKKLSDFEGSGFTIAIHDMVV
jgi:hypothetical protein